MRQLFNAASFALMLAIATTASGAEVPSYIGKRVSSPEDIAAIERLIEDFKDGIKNRNRKKLASLLHNSHILLETPMPPEVIKNVREKHNAHFDGLPNTGYRWFMDIVAETKGKPEERFFNVKITQDGHVAWVMFDFDFLRDGAPTNHGYEVWQLMKNAQGQWRIISVVWTGNTPGNPGAAGSAGVPDYIGKRVESEQDKAAIERVAEDFRTALKSKNTRQLSSLLLKDSILFAAPDSPEIVKVVREEIDPNYDGLPPSGFYQFAHFVLSEKAAIEERFFNMKITQDGHVAWVMFDYDFLIGGKPQNHGVETWQMIKNAEGQWRIASVVWSMNPVR